MTEKIKKKIQETEDKWKAEEQKLGKEASDGLNKLKEKVRKAAGKSDVTVDDNAVPPD
jgi:hypothetical protein